MLYLASTLKDPDYGIYVFLCGLHVKSTTVHKHEQGEWQVRDGGARRLHFISSLGLEKCLSRDLE